KLEPVSLEPKRQRRVERRLVGYDFDREDVVSRPRPARRKQGLLGHAQELIDTVRKTALAFHPCSEADRRPLLSSGRANDQRRRLRVEIEFHGLNTAIVSRKLIPLSRYSNGIRSGRLALGHPDGELGKLSPQLHSMFHILLQGTLFHRRE